MKMVDGASFWRRNEPRVMGDLIGRPQAIDLLGDVQGGRVFDLGCGTGYVSRRLRSKGARVLGLDNDPEAIRIARQLHNEEAGLLDNSQRTYRLADIRGELERLHGWPQHRRERIISVCSGDGRSAFHLRHETDAAISVSVLPYMPPRDVMKAFQAAYTALKRGGRFVVSVAHPSLAEDSSIARNDENNWLYLEPLGDEMGEYDTLFRQHYKDVDGVVWTKCAWYHPTERYVSGALSAGFHPPKLYERELRPEHLRSSEWGSEYGYPVYLQLECIKPSGENDG